MKPVIFISATSDLRSARDLVGKILYSMGYEPVWQEIASTDGGELLDVLRRRIAPASMVIQLVGRRYGAEPPQPTSEFGRVSYTQFEALEAEKLGKRVIYHFLDDRFPTDPAQAESPEAEALQTKYRLGLKEHNRLRYGGIASTGDLELSIRRISDELAELRKQSERRQRNLFALAISAVLGVAVVGALVFVAIRHANKTDTLVTQKTAEINDKLAKLEQYTQQLRPLAEPKPQAVGQSTAQGFPPEVIEKAKYLAEFGSEEQKALGLIFLKKHAEADKIIQDLKSKPGNPIDEAFRLCMMEGDNWYQAQLTDRAIPAYEKAVALKGNDARARNSLASALVTAREGDLLAKQKRAREIAQTTLTLVPPKSLEWAQAQAVLGIAWSLERTRDPATALNKALAAFNAALEVYKVQGNSADLPVTRMNIGLIYCDLPTGDRLENYHKSMEAFDAALAAVSREKDPLQWAMVQANFGIVWFGKPDGSREANLAKSIACFNEALKIYTKDAQPGAWAMTTANLANAWSQVESGDRAANLKKAIDACNAALTVYTRELYPAEWARTQVNLGAEWDNLPSGDASQNAKEALKAYEAALTVYTRDAYPVEWAHAQKDIGLAWSHRTDGDADANWHNARTAYDNAFTVYSRESLPAEWARMKVGLGNLYFYARSGSAAENLKQALALYNEGLQVYTRQAEPILFGETWINIGNTYAQLGDLGATENYKRAADAYETALPVFDRDANHGDWLQAAAGLAIVYAKLPNVDGDPVVRKKAAAATATMLDAMKGEKSLTARFALETTLSWYQLISKDYAGALATAELDATSGKIHLPLETNRAHALLMLGRTDEAAAIYLKHVGERVPEANSMWETVILDDFDALEKKGITSPEMTRIRAQLQARSTSRPVAHAG